MQNFLQVLQLYPRNRDLHNFHCQASKCRAPICIATLKTPSSSTPAGFLQVLWWWWCLSWSHWLPAELRARRWGVDTDCCPCQSLCSTTSTPPTSTAGSMGTPWTWRWWCRRSRSRPTATLSGTGRPGRLSLHKSSVSCQILDIHFILCVVLQESRLYI